MAGRGLPPRVKYKVCYLEITTYHGYALGAQHYYGRLTMSGRHDVELEHPLTAEEVAVINRESQYDWLYQPGQTYPGFTTRQDVIRLARRTWKQHFPDADILILGRKVYAEPQRVIYGPKEWKKTVNFWWDSLGRIGRDRMTHETLQIDDNFWRYFLETTE